MENIEVYLEETDCFDYSSEEIQDILKSINATEKYGFKLIEELYLKVRDGWRYDPYNLSINPDHFKSSTIANRSYGHCIDKSILYVSLLRACGIPARLHLAKVKNHIAVERLTEQFGTNELTPHGMVDVFNGTEWVKANPAFNKALCEKCNVEALDFTGEEDSIFQEFNSDGNQFMEYLEDYGHFPDLPIDFIKENLFEHYPELKGKFDDSGKINLAFNQ